MARPASKFAKITDTKQNEALAELWKTHPNHYTRIRAHAIILSSQGHDVKSLVQIFGVDRDSVQSWIDRFEAGGVDALRDAERPGGPPKLDDGEQELLRDLFRKFPNRPLKVRAELKERTGKAIGETTLHNYARRFGLNFKRFRRSLRNRRSEKAFRIARAELGELLNEPDLNVVYFDEAGFSLKGLVPYGWQPIGERLEVPVTGAHGSNVQAIAFEGQDGETAAYLHKGSVNTDVVIQVFDDYSQQIEQTTVVILDNASPHTSAAFLEALERWAERGLFVYHLPAYSPELNAIERLWKKVKYQLMPPTAWERFTTLLTSLTTTLVELGEVTYMPSLQNYAE